MGFWRDSSQWWPSPAPPRVGKHNVQSGKDTPVPKHKQSNQITATNNNNNQKTALAKKKETRALPFGFLRNPFVGENSRTTLATQSQSVTNNGETVCECQIGLKRGKCETREGGRVTTRIMWEHWFSSTAEPTSSLCGSGDRSEAVTLVSARGSRMPRPFPLGTPPTACSYWLPRGQRPPFTSPSRPAIGALVLRHRSCVSPRLTLLIREILCNFNR